MKVAKGLLYLALAGVLAALTAMVIQQGQAIDRLQDAAARARQQAYTIREPATLGPSDSERIDALERQAEWEQLEKAFSLR